MKITVEYEYPRPPEAYDAERELGRLDELERQIERLDESNPDRDALVEKLPDDVQEKRQELIAAMPPVERIRVHVREVSYLGRARYFKLWREGEEYFEEHTGLSFQDSFDQPDPDRNVLRDLLMYRSEILAAIQMEGDRYKAEIMKCPYGQEAAAGWEAGYLPDDWVAVDTMGDCCPADFLDDLIEATRRLNAGILTSIPDFLAPRRSTRSVSA